ncbi:MULTISPECIES: DUF1450 domain-containing protein [Shouchella]|uniref:DUF1450 domain-containing protein n=2 Tax=Shouchella TaxID=2893057 RepID=A0ABY7WDZ4_9BACI|nr:MULTISPECIES: DUF1450 domain-containing protein [Shouchella]MED4130319.1 DUF1450 domain-containing protein [Shouchella miscanthi]WDF05849.1 DUF1450 domain-containing protein [Shouchella hunanensis]
MLIECCMNNVHNGTDEVINSLLSLPHVEIVEYGCLTQCGVCNQEHFLFINDTYVAGETPAQLLEKINKICFTLT